MPLNRTSDCRSAGNQDDRIETALVWAARWTPDSVPREGMLAEALLRSSRERSSQGHGLRGLLPVIATALVAIVAIGGWIAVEHATLGSSTGNRRSLGDSPPTSGTGREQPDPTLSAGRPPFVQPDPGQGAAFASTAPRQARPTIVRVASARLCTRPPRKAHGADTTARATGEAPQWRTYTVPRYVAGVSASGWLAERGSDGDAQLVPVTVHMPIAEGYGHPGDHDESDFDVIPVKHILEVYDE